MRKSEKKILKQDLILVFYVYGKSRAINLTVQRDLVFEWYSLSSGGVFDDSEVIFERFVSSPI